ncbi:MAG TPA: LytTR family DNA-binding domain-containing protein [Puia sp.]|nr:LytTR family DNA-binding domain-containing protein [Puia sp.]
MTCIAIDDEPMALEVIERYCAKTGLVELKGVFRESIKAIEYLSTEKIDLVFLDINMPEISGVQLAKSISPAPMIIFTTAYSHYAVESYNLNAVDYLLKPITFERFLTSIRKALTAIATRNNSIQSNDDPVIFIKSGLQTYQVKLRDILYLEKQGNYLNVHLKDKKIIIRENMVDVFHLVPSGEFIRVHKSYVVAVKHIVTIEVHQLTINNEKIPIGSTYREALRNRLGIR